MRYWTRYFLPGILLILLAFWAGSLPSMIFALIGFLSFFVVGVTLIIEGAKQRNDRGATHHDKR